MSIKAYLNNSVKVQFTTPFSGTPKIGLIGDNQNAKYLNVSSISNTGFTLSAQSDYGDNRTFTFKWFAVLLK